MPKRVLYTRADGKWTWRLEADNDGILATDGGPGYENEAEARSVADRIIAGEFREAHRTIVRPPKPIDQRFVENIADALRIQAGAQAITASESLHVPIEDVPPGLSRAERQQWREWWEEHHPESPPTPDLLGPWTVPINFSGPTPVGGWAQLTIRRNGSWNFSGGLRDCGLPSFDDAVVFVVKNLGTDESYQFVHQGRMHGTLEAGSHDDYWDESGNNSQLADDWDALFIDGHHWHCRVGINVDVAALTEAAQKAVGVAATTISIT
jgi:uncharacterized protein YegP (UPF0339 family)